jgi:aminoglycoside phosphotransferase (APT) family kinase protein
VPEVQRAALREAVRAAGVALASLHGSDLATAPVRSLVKEQAVLRRELALVEAYWPDVAAAVGSAVDGALAAATTAPDMVLSHGDFTPSQVLLDGSGTAVVDLDTLCWADPALDLGRFLAHLELLAVKQGGEAATPVVHDLTRAFLDGYSGAGARTAAAAEANERVALYRGTTFARTALRASRQLKEYRVGLALSLLDSITTRRVDL